MDRILLIEGNPYLGANLVSALSDGDFETRLVSNYFEALKELDNCEFSLIIIDKELLVIDAFESCRQLNQILNIPIILLGRDSGVETQIKAIEAGADLYLKKPFGYIELAARVKAILRRYAKTYFNS